MSAADTIFDTVEAMSAPETLPARLVHAPAAMLTAARVFLMLPAAIALAAPALLAVALMVRVGPLTLLLDNPVTLVALCLQPLLWVIVAKFTISGILPRLGAERRAYINAREVRVAERRLGRLYIWRQPLTNYRGIAHTVKATLGGIHHELVLVHPISRRSILLHSATTIDQACIDRYRSLLGQVQIPARDLYPLPRPLRTRPWATASAPV